MSQTAIEILHEIANRQEEISLEDGAVVVTESVAIEAMTKFAALSALTQGGVKVKELAWISNGGSYLDASSVAGNYEIQLGGAAYDFSLNGRYTRETYPTLEAAKAAAQADYESRIRSALSTKLQEPVGDDLATRFAKLVSEYRSDTDGPHGEAMREEIEMLVMDNLDTIAASLDHPLAKIGSPDEAIETLLWMRDRDNELGSLPPKYREKIDATLAHQPVTAGWNEAIQKCMDAVELYADSYARMSKIGDGKVSASDVAYDLRNNVIARNLAALKSEGR